MNNTLTTRKSYLPALNNACNDRIPKKYVIFYNTQTVLTRFIFSNKFLIHSDSLHVHWLPACTKICGLHDFDLRDRRAFTYAT